MTGPAAVRPPDRPAPRGDALTLPPPRCLLQLLLLLPASGQRGGRWMVRRRLLTRRQPTLPSPARGARQVGVEGGWSGAGRGQRVR